MTTADPPPAAARWQPLAPRWPSLRPGRALVLPLPAAPLPGLPATLAVDTLAFRRKHEFHLTLLDTATSARLADALAALPTAQARRWRQMVMALDWRWRSLPPPWLVARPAGDRPATSSIVLLLEQPAQARFRAAASALLEASLPDALPHVTLYTAGNRAGISLSSPAVFADRRVRTLPPALLACD